MGAVVANAIYDAVGVRLLQLPMTPARVLEALKRRA
jgi:CO/xanthine dehydrogenase Mo-binding subunit